MLPDYQDIRVRIPEDPKWYDEHGVPRYCVFRPNEVDVYAYDVALIEVACQNCGRLFRVAITYNQIDLISRKAKYKRPEKLDIGSFHYGDPPRHSDVRQDNFEGSTGDCTGVTMNVETVRVLEFWTREDSHDWRRLVQHEVYIGQNESNDA